MENTKELNRAKKLFSKRLSALIQNQGVQQNILADKIGVSESTVGKWLLEKALPRMGAIQKLSDYFRVPKSYFLEENYDTETQETPRRKGVKIPIYGSIVAGVPETAEQQVLGWFEIPEELAERGDYYMLKVHGMSMSPDICDGDYVLVRQQETAHSGDICVVNVNGDECTLKEVQIKPEGVLLIGYNQAEYKPKFYTKEEVERLPLRIQGVVIQCIRKYKEY